MPELPEVETVVRTLIPSLVGRRFRNIAHLRADIVEPADVDLTRVLKNRRVIGIDRRGKKILIRLERDETLCVHLGMTGRLTVEKPREPIKPHTHLIVGLSGKTQLRFRDPRRFGGIFWLCNGEAEDANLGPEPRLRGSRKRGGRLRRRCWISGWWRGLGIFMRMNRCFMRGFIRALLRID